MLWLLSEIVSEYDQETPQSQTADNLGCCQAHQGLPVGFLLLEYTDLVLFTVDSLYLLYLLFYILIYML